MVDDGLGVSSSLSATIFVQCPQECNYKRHIWIIQIIIYIFFIMLIEVALWKVHSWDWLFFFQLIIKLQSAKILRLHEKWALRFVKNLSMYQECNVCSQSSYFCEINAVLSMYTCSWVKLRDTPRLHSCHSGSQHQNRSLDLCFHSQCRLSPKSIGLQLEVKRWLS